MSDIRITPFVCLLLVALVPAWLGHAQTPDNSGIADNTLDENVATENEVAPPKQLDNPFDAFDTGAFDQALQGFVDQQVERPDDEALTLNIGSAHYKMKNYEEAEKAFASVALSGTDSFKGQAFYNLGNCAYRQGKLQEAVELYKRALEINPDDEDAKFNLEYVRDEIRRRHEEQKKRQEEQDQQQQNQDQQQQQQDQQQQQQQSGQDKDQDGLSDEQEQSAKNKTDPEDPDSDDDKLKDGEEDKNRNGQVDPGETDPNNPDTDNDGVSDYDEVKNNNQEPQENQSEESEGLSEEEAERYLQALEEGQPKQRHPQQRGKKRRPVKDW